MNLRSIYYLILGIPIFLLQTSAFAEDNFSDSDLFSDTEESQLFQNIPSVYSASKYEQKVTKAPASISVVTADEIKKYGYRTFSDILSSLKGFYSTNNRNYGSAGARGVGIPLDFNTRLLLLIDGHRFNDNIFDSFDISEGFPIDIDIIERVEVVRGPASSLYGTNAFFGVINVITRRGRDQNGVNVTASYGSFDNYKTRISYGNRFNSGVEMFLSGTFIDNQGNKRLNNESINSLLHNTHQQQLRDNTAINNNATVHNNKTQNKKLIGTITYGNFTLQGLYTKNNRDIPAITFGPTVSKLSVIEKGMDESTFVELKYDRTFTNQLNLQSRLSYNNYRYNGIYPHIINNETPSPFIIKNQDKFRGQWWRGELQATQILFADHKVTIGSEFQHNFQQSQLNFDLQTHIKSDRNSYRGAFFIQDEYTLNEKISLNAGVRFDHFSTFGGTVNPRAGLIYSPWIDTSVKLLYGTAFRAPSQFELNYLDISQRAEKLRPEKLQTLELILEKYLTQQTRAELNLFHTQIRDLIAFTENPDGFLENRNLGDAESIGAEVQLETNYSTGYQGRISYSIQETKDRKTHKRLTNSPTHMVKLNLIAPLWPDKVFVGFETQYMSSRKSPTGNKVSDHVISNLTLFNQNWIKGLELSAGAYNLFDEHYFDPGSQARTQKDIEQFGLTFRLRASMNF